LQADVAIKEVMVDPVDGLRRFAKSWRVWGGELLELKRSPNTPFFKSRLSIVWIAS
jgi:hypothetical protein